MGHTSAQAAHTKRGRESGDQSKGIERKETKLWNGLRRQLDTYRRRYRENAWKENGCFCCWVRLCKERQPTCESEVYYWTSQRWSYLEKVGVCFFKRLRV